jgi:iron donor protein CyaY
MMLTDQEFQQKCDLCLESLYSSLARAADDFDFDVDMNNGALTVEFDDPPERFVVSPNSPVRQIWVSALVQSFKFDWNGADFVLPASGQTLPALMAEVIRKRIPDFTL